MIDELNQALETYHAKWHKLIAGRKNKVFFEKLKPTSVGWKVEDLADFDKQFAALRDQCDQVHLGWINERWLATLYLKDETLNGGIKIIKLMQRRPGSTDATGLDHLDFYSPKVSKALLEQEPDLKWSEENNGQHCKWLSVWFDGAEAKLRTNTVLQVCADELLDYQTGLTSDLDKSR